MLNNFWHNFLEVADLSKQGGMGEKNCYVIINSINYGREKRLTFFTLQDIVK